MNQETTKNICLSNQSQSPNQDGSFTFNISRLSTKLVRGVTFKNFTIRNVFPNVFASGPLKNNVFSFIVGFTAHTINVPQGYYTASALISYLKPLIDTILLTSGIVPLPTLDSFVYDPTLLKFVLTFNGNGAPTVIILNGDNTQLSINTIMGNTADLVFPTDPAAATPLQSIVSMGGVDVVCVCSPEIASANSYHNGIRGADSGGRLSNCIQMVAMNAGFGELVLYNSFDTDADSILYERPRDCTQINIMITDVAGNILPLFDSTFNIQFLAYMQS